MIEVTPSLWFDDQAPKAGMQRIETDELERAADGVAV